MRIGIYQYAPLWGNAIGNLAKIKRVLSAHQADLWVLPELGTTGYLFTSAAEAQQYAEEIPSGVTATRLAALSRQYETGLICGVAELAGGQVFNSAVCFHRGRWLGAYRKVHLFDTEQELFQRGTQPPPVIQIGTTRVGIMICFDWIFPEMARTLALKGAQLIAHPANLVLPYCQAAMLTRSLENRVFTITANRIGSERRAGRELSFTGRSQVVAPNGTILRQLSTEKEEVLVLDIEPAAADDKKFGPGNDLFQERYPAAYLC